jgi:F0F1-type ATP synthase assembly protein I
MRDSGVTKYPLAGLPAMLFSPRMQGNPRSSFQPVEAGAVLAGTMGACGGAGALVGWAAGSTGYGALAGVVIGLPAGVFAVYRRFKGYFS